jgi:hypothetical protein
MKLPSKEELCSILDYNAETGDLTWRARDMKWFAHTSKPEALCMTWNKKFAGKPALNSVCHWGYRVGRLFNKSVKAHRVIWKMEDGS